MNRWLFMLMLVSCRAQAEKPVEINVATNAKCSPAVGINYGYVTVNCNDPKLEERLRSLPDLANYNLNMAQLV